MKKTLAALLLLVLTAVQARAGTSIIEFHGAATLASQGLAPRPVASAPLPLAARDVLRTAGDAGLTIRFSDGSETRLGPNATFIVVEESPSLIALLLERGKAWAHVSKRPSRSFELRTATAVAAVRGTRFSVEARDDGATRVEVEEGLVAVSAAGAAAHGGTLLLGPGQSALAQGGSVAPAPAEPASPPAAPAPAPASQDDGRQGALDAPTLDRSVVEREAELQVQQDALQATLSQSAVGATSSLQTAVTRTSVAAAAALPVVRTSNSGPGSVNSGSGSSNSGPGSTGSGSLLQPVLGTTCTVTCVLGVCVCK